MPAQSVAKLPRWKAMTEVIAPAAPRSAASTKPARRPMRCMSREAGSVANVLPRTENVNGSEDSEASGAKARPARTVTPMLVEAAQSESAWHAASTKTLRRSFCTGQEYRNVEWKTDEHRQGARGRPDDARGPSSGP